MGAGAGESAESRAIIHRLGLVAAQGILPFVPHCQDGIREFLSLSFFVGASSILAVLQNVPKRVAGQERA